MLRIFEQIFGGDSRSATSHPEDLIKRATERALDATDPRVRILSGYARQMRPAVIHAIDHVLQLVDALAPPVPMTPAGWATQPVMSAMFYSADSLQTAIERDAAAKDFVAANPQVTEPVMALLLAKQSRKVTYGYDLVGDKTMSDVPLTVVSFDEHRLQGLALAETETRRLLKLRAFDYLLVLALRRITDTQARRQDLVVRKKLLKTKLDILARSSGSLLEEPRSADRESLQQKMNQVETELSELGEDASVLQTHLDLIVETLISADKQLWLVNETFYIDQMRYLREPAHPQAVAVPVQMLHDATGHEMAAQMVVMPPELFAKK